MHLIITSKTRCVSLPVQFSSRRYERERRRPRCVGKGWFFFFFLNFILFIYFFLLKMCCPPCTSFRSTQRQSVTVVRKRIRATWDSLMWIFFCASLIVYSGKLWHYIQEAGILISNEGFQKVKQVKTELKFSRMALLLFGAREIIRIEMKHLKS